MIQNNIMTSKSNKSNIIETEICIISYYLILNNTIEEIKILEMYSIKFHIFSFYTNF